MKLRPILLTLILLAWALPGAAETVALPAALSWDVAPLERIDGHTAEVFDREGVALEDELREAEGLPWRFALPEDVQLTPDNSGTWETLPDGRLLWRLRLTGPGALSMNLGFSRFWMPGDTRLLVYAPDAPGEARAYGRDHHADHGQLWTPVVFGDEVVVEVAIEAALRPELILELLRVNRGYRLFNEDPAEKSGACNIDVVCSQGDDWRDEIDTVGMVSISGTEKCSGWMANNTAQDGRPLFITAAHCALNSGNDQTLVVYWNYQSPVCGQVGGGSKLDAQAGGATWLATTDLSDFTIVELTQDPEPEWGVKFAGWNRSTDDPTSAVAVHHPSTDEKSISFENDPLSTTSYYGSISPGDGSHLRVDHWDEGTTEGGSSGSPLFDQDGYVVGELHGGEAACGNNSPDWYGRLSYAWDEGSTGSSRLRDHLDPGGTGGMTTELFDPEGPGFMVNPDEDFLSSGAIGGPFDPSATTYTLVNTGTNPTPFTVVADPPTWLEITPSTGTIPVGGQVQVGVALGPEASNLGGGIHESSVTFRVTDSPIDTAIRQVQLTVHEAVFSVQPEEDFASSGMVGGPFSPPVTTYTLVNTGAIPAPFTVEGGPESWVVITPTSGIIPVDGQAEVQIALGPAASILNSGVYTSTVTFRITDSDSDLGYRGVQLTITAEPAPFEGPIPNPFRDYTEVHFNLDEPAVAQARVLDLKGRLVNNLGSKDCPAGGNTWAWGGDDSDGRRLPSGVYVFELRIGDVTTRMNLTYIH